jgi:putative membrane protein
MEENTTKRDTLANQRTHMANERTMLAYIRTSIALLGVGILLMKYQPSIITMSIGVGSVILSLVFLIIGIYRFKKIKIRINKNN